MKTDPVYDVLVIGSGAAGLSLALEVAKKASVAVISKAPPEESSTYYAQGGIAAVLDETDSISSHIDDTLDAGAGKPGAVDLGMVAATGDVGVLLVGRTAELGGEDHQGF